MNNDTDIPKHKWERKQAEVDALSDSLGKAMAQNLALRDELKRIKIELAACQISHGNESRGVDRLRGELRSHKLDLIILQETVRATEQERDQWRDMARELAEECRLWSKAFQQQDPKASVNLLLARFAAMEKGTP